jgi:photosystem II stability/assembly factor-like uncharacterized protein
VRGRQRAGTLSVACACLVAVGAARAGDAPAAAEMAPLAVRSLLLGVCAAGPDRLVAVGERGHVLVSVDGGVSWLQKPAPTRATLTAVFFVDAQNGWAVGHDELILRTMDGGESWTLAHDDPQSQQPLLDLWFRDARTGIAVGAYSSVLVSGDGGASWRVVEFSPLPASHQSPNARVARRDEEGVAQPHLYAIAAGSHDTLYVAGEAGHLYRSDDGGRSWQELPSPYRGSFFGLLPLGDDALLAFGLRGHLYRSEDAGRHFRELPTRTDAQLSGGARFADGAVVLVGLSGVVLYSRDGREFRLHQEADRKSFSAVAVQGDVVVLVGEDGVRRLPRSALAQ